MNPSPYPVIDCGSGYHFGICPKCGRGHGHVLIGPGGPLRPPAKPKPAPPRIDMAKVLQAVSKAHSSASPLKTEN